MILQDFINSYPDIGMWILRLSVAAIFIYHSIPKLRAPSAMAGSIGWGSGAVLILGFVELICGIGLIFSDAYAQVSAILLGIVMFGAIYYKIIRWHVPFSAHDKTGWEFDLILLTALVAIFYSST